MNDTADVSIGSSIFMLAPPVDGGARTPSLYRRRTTAVGFPGSSGSVCPDLSTTLPKGPPYPGGPFLSLHLRSLGHHLLSCTRSAHSVPSLSLVLGQVLDALRLELAFRADEFFLLVA